MFKDCELEVLELHRFFQRWFLGELAKTNVEFGRFAEVMAEGFAIVSPRGTLTEREALAEGLKAAHGSWKAGRIWIENLKVRRVAGESALVTYEEWQQTGADPRGRLSSAWFRRRAGLPNGVEWLHVHETWLDPGA